MGAGDADYRVGIVFMGCYWTGHLWSFQNHGEVSMKQPGLKEKDITMQIRNLLKTFQIFHWKNHGGPMGAKGVPDILGCFQGKFLGIEVKTENGRLSPEQDRFIKNLNDAGGIAFVARSVDDVIEKLGLKARLLF
jgi:hypothetical protein